VVTGVSVDVEGVKGGEKRKEFVPFLNFLMAENDFTFKLAWIDLSKRQIMAVSLIFLPANLVGQKSLTLLKNKAEIKKLA
jgi:hypothetical protein